MSNDEIKNIVFALTSGNCKKSRDIVILNFDCSDCFWNNGEV